MRAPPFTVADGFTLDSLRPQDEAALVRCLADGEVASFIPVLPQPYGPAEARAWIKRRLAFLGRHGQEVSFAVRDSTGAVVGSLGFDDFPIDLAHEAEFGGWLVPMYRGQGLATTCARIITQYGFDVLKLSRIRAHTMVWNDRSARFLQKVGFKEEGRLPRHTLARGELHDVIAYGLTPEDVAQRG